MTYLSGIWTNSAAQSDVPSVEDEDDGDILTLVDGVPSWRPPLDTVQVETTGSTILSPGLDDAGKYFRCTASIDITVTIPLHATAALPIGTRWKWRQCGDGTVRLVGEDDLVLLNTISGYLTESGAEGAVIEAVKVDEDEWDVFGFLAIHS